MHECLLVTIRLQTVFRDLTTYTLIPVYPSIGSILQKSLYGNTGNKKTSKFNRFRARAYHSKYLEL